MTFIFDTGCLLPLEPAVLGGPLQDAEVSDFP